MLNWYDLALKLHLQDLPPNCYYDAPVVENIVKFLCSESSIRSRRKQEVVVRGLATVPRVFKSMPSLEQSKDLMKKTLRQSKDAEDMPMHYPTLHRNTNEQPFHEELNMDSIFDPVKNIEQVEMSSGAVVALWESVDDAAKATGVVAHIISSSLNGKPVPEGSQYKWRYSKPTMRYGDALPEKFDPIPVKDKSTVLKEAAARQKNGQKEKASSENWIPEITRMRSVHRHIAAAKETVQDMHLREINNEREMKQFKRSAFQKAVALEDLGVQKKQACGCCYQMFSLVNLPLKVSNKAVVDMRKKFANDEKEIKKEFYIKPVVETKRKDMWWIKIDEKLSNLSRCYDDVNVCIYCSQFFKDQDSYRPTYETVQYEERKKAYFEQKRLERAYWDPLAMSEADKERQRIEVEQKAVIEAAEMVSDSASVIIDGNDNISEADSESYSHSGSNHKKRESK